MHRSTRAAVAFAAAFVVIGLAARPAVAQSDTLLDLRSTAAGAAGVRFVVDSAGGILARGTIGRGTIPATGAGTRLLWYPSKGAFRVGTVLGTTWDDASVGSNSVAMGYNTRATGHASTAMGGSTTAGGSYSTAMGHSTTAGGSYSTAIGIFTAASVQYAIAMGVRARAGHAGSFVWGSSLTNGGVPSDSIRSTAHGQFSLRAMGGIRMFTNEAMSAGVTMSAGGSTWNAVSDRHRKENFAAVDGEEILDRLRGVPVTSWNYIAEGREVRHIGPMAQDWNSAFRLNDDPLTINQGDFDGVNLAAIHALEARTREQADRIRALEAETARMATLEQENAALRSRLERIEQMLTTHAPRP